MNLADELRKLAELREAGHLTDQEFADAKRRLIADAGAEPPPLPKEEQTVPSRLAPPPISKKKQTVPDRVAVPTSQKKWGCIGFGVLVLFVIYMCQQANRSGSKSGSSASLSNAPAASPTRAPETALATPAPSPTRAPETALATPAASPAPAPLSAEDQAFVDSGGYWIKGDTWAGRSKDDLKALINMAGSDDIHAQAQMVREGRAVILKQGQRVQLQEVAMFGGMEKVRPVGETNGWWIALGHSSKTPVLTPEEKLSAVQATTAGITQKPLTGALSSIKLFVSQPLAAWKKAYPSGKPTLLNPNAYNFNAGRFVITVSFDENSGLPKLVSISEAEGKAPMTVKEATQIADSIGLSKPVKDAKDPSFLNWNNEGDPLFASFNKDDPALTIEVKP
jgi:hypothetical protein